VYLLRFVNKKIYFLLFVQRLNWIKRTCEQTQMTNLLQRMMSLYCPLILKQIVVSVRTRL